jgi:predicted transcriptional regulator
VEIAVRVVVRDVAVEDVDVAEAAVAAHLAMIVTATPVSSAYRRQDHGAEHD